MIIVDNSKSMKNWKQFKIHDTTSLARVWVLLHSLVHGTPMNVTLIDAQNNLYKTYQKHLGICALCFSPTSNVSRFGYVREV